MERSVEHDNSAHDLPLEPDLARLLTPARRLTLGRLYELFGSRDDSYPVIAAAAQTMLLLEDRIATIPYHWAIGLADKTPEALKEHKGDRELLTQWYLRTRLATGPHQAEELIRDIVDQALRQVPDRPPR
jgi:hypothetical protein